MSLNNALVSQSLVDYSQASKNKNGWLRFETLHFHMLFHIGSIFSLGFNNIGHPVPDDTPQLPFHTLFVPEVSSAWYLRKSEL